MSAHPLDAYAGQLRRLRVTDAADLTTGMAGTAPNVAGVVISRQERTSARGTASPSSTCRIRLVCSRWWCSRTARHWPQLLEGGQRVLITVDVRADDGAGVRLSATNVRPLDEALANASTELQIVIEDEEAIPVSNTR